jgi:hypothetical protein
MADIKVGSPDTRIDKSSHVPGVRQGNHEGNAKHQRGHNRDDTSTARRSTGINPGKRDAIMPGMPNISPA